MPTPGESPHLEDPPEWALQEAIDQLDDASDRLALTERAWELARERDEERHDEYDDPDEGGEA